ncbi:hypothetical protein BJX99DRAFT_261071 [Aspergillus californicus]
MDSLAVVTKAGVPPQRLVIGASSCGRSFKIAEGGCTGPRRNTSVNGTNPLQSTASAQRQAHTWPKKEIEKLKRLGECEWTESYDELSDSTILVYDDVEWVTYMDSDDYSDDDVYETPGMECNAPCTIVLPPSALPETTTITIGPYTTSVQIEGTTTKITVTPDPLTIDTMSFYNVSIPLMDDNSTMV